MHFEPPCMCTLKVAVGQTLYMPGWVIYSNILCMCQKFYSSFHVHSWHPLVNTHFLAYFTCYTLYNIWITLYIVNPCTVFAILTVYTFRIYILLYSSNVNFLGYTTITAKTCNSSKFCTCNTIGSQLKKHGLRSIYNEFVL